jgi:hypothetical protein
MATEGKERLRQGLIFGAGSSTAKASHYPHRVEGYTYPKAERAVRDVLRKRAHLVRQQTAHVLSLQTSIARNTGVRLSAKRMHALTLEDLERLLPVPEHLRAVTSSLVVVHCLAHQIKTLEEMVQKRLKHTAAYAQLQSVDGIGPILAQTIVREVTF